MPRVLRVLLRWSHSVLLLAGFAALGAYGFAMLDASSFYYYNDPVPLPVAMPPAAAESAVISLPESAPLGQIEIPRVGVSAPILAGVSSRTLRLAAGHVPGTALPGERGNVAIAAHRDTFFRGLSKIRESDEVLVTTSKGLQVYRVR